MKGYDVAYWRFAGLGSQEMYGQNACENHEFKLQECSNGRCIVIVYQISSHIDISLKYQIAPTDQHVMHIVVRISTK